MSTTAFVFLLLVCVWVPYLAWKSSQRLGGGPIPLSPTQLFTQVIATQLFLLIVALAAARSSSIVLWRLPRRPLASWITAAMFFTLILTALKLRWGSRPVEEKRRLYSMLPHNRAELPIYACVALSAGIGEEIVYRGVLTALLWTLTGNLIVAGIISAAVFGLSHIVQGWRAVVAIFGIALLSQALVTFSASLLPVMAVHALYDFVAGILIPRWYERDNAVTASTLSDAVPAVGR